MKSESIAHFAPIAPTAPTAPIAPATDASIRVGPEAREAFGRFREARGTKRLRATLGALSKLSPALAAQVGYRLLATPPRADQRPWQCELHHTARRSWLRVGGAMVAVYEWGHRAAPTILMVHGWGACATHMGRLIEPLTTRDYRVVSFDAPAHGDSNGSTTDLVEFAGAVHAVARFAGPLHAVIAHSFGAAAALLAARDWGTDANRLVLIGAFDHCGWFYEDFGHYAGLMPEVIDRMQAMLVERHNGRIDWDRLSVVEMLREARRPALLIHDEDDAEVPFTHSVAFLNALPNVALHATRGLGHHRLLADRSVIDRLLQFVSAN